MNSRCTMQSFANILNMKYYYSDQAQSPFIEVDSKEDLLDYPEKMWWESEDGIVLTMITEIP
jgi:hypothetical protein